MDFQDYSYELLSLVSGKCQIPNLVKILNWILRVRMYKSEETMIEYNILLNQYRTNVQIIRKLKYKLVSHQISWF